MKKYRVKVEIGGKEYKYIVESPVALSPSEARAKANQELSEPQRLRAFIQGASLGFGEEIEAGVKSVAGGDYEQERDALRAQLASYQEQNPLSSAGYEIAGAIPTTLLAARTGSPVAAAAPLSRIGAITQRAAPIAVESALAAYGYSDAEELGETMRDIGMGTTVGTAAGGLGYALSKGIGALGNKLLSYTREKMGDKASDAVQAELKRLVDITGKNEEEILADVMDGKTISDNKTLVIALKNYVNEGGEAAREILERTSQREATQRAAGQASLESGLTAGQSGNQLRRAQMEDDELRSQVNDLYSRAFGRSGGPSSGMIGQLQDIIQRFPKAADDVAEVYRARNLVPLFAKDDAGAIQMVRQPTAQDAEMIYRAMRDFTQQSNMAGQGALGEVAGDTTRAIKGAIDTEFPDVRRARAVAQTRFGAKDALELGRKALTKDPEEVQIALGDMGETELKAYRTGLMNAINRKMQTGTAFRDLADENKNIGKILRMSLEPDQVDGIVAQMQRTADNIEIKQKMPSMAGSPTAPLQQERARAGQSFNVGQVVDTLSGSPVAGMQMISQLFEKAASGLTPQQRMQVVNVIFSEDPALVRAALTDNTALARLEQKIKTIADTMGKSAQRATQQQAIQVSQQ